MRHSDRQRGGCTGAGFVPGQSGNPGGRPKGALSLSGLIREALSEDDGAKGRELVDRLVQMALDGDVRAIQAILDRLEGRPQQRVALGMDMGERIERMYRMARGLEVRELDHTANLLEEHDNVAHEQEA